MRYDRWTDVISTSEAALAHTFVELIWSGIIRPTYLGLDVWTKTDLTWRCVAGHGV